MCSYKPQLYPNSTIPNTSAGFNRSSLMSSDFNISPYVMLPDSFGDIYVGELFSAYIAVLNGMQDRQFEEVSLAIRLQTANLTHDFADVRPSEGITSGYSKSLSPNASMDMVVQHYISEPGVHTLRVSVQYADYITNEPKTIRKFYRFNVTSPMEIKASVHEINDNYYVQCQVTNTMKLPIYIEKVCLQMTLIYLIYELTLL